MDYAFKIRELEKDLQHYREKQALMREHVDAHDLSLDHIRQAFSGASDRFDRIEVMLEATATNVKHISDALRNLAEKINKLHPNGGGSQ